MNTQPKITFERASQERMARFNPIRNLTPARLSSDIDQFHAGHLAPFARMMDAMKRKDDVLCVVAPKREAAPARRNWEILTVTDTAGREAEAQRHKEALEHFYNHLTVTSAVDLDQRGGVRLLIRQVMSAVGFKYAVHHIVWQPTPGGLTAELIHCPLWFFESRTGKLRFLRNESGWDGDPMQPGEWLVAVYDSWVMEACAVACMMKHLPLKDWLIFSQDFGKPFIEGLTDAAKGSEEWSQLRDAVDALAADLRLVRSRSSEIKLTDITRGGSQPYAPLVERMDRALARLWRGADLSTLSAGAGAGQGASLQGDEKDQLEQDDAQFVSETCNLGLDELVIQYQFGPGTKPLAYFKIVIPPRQNVAEEIQITEHLTRHGVALSVKEERERFNRPVPDAGEEVLNTPDAPRPAISQTPGTAQPAGFSPEAQSSKPKAQGQTTGE